MMEEKMSTRRKYSDEFKIKTVEGYLKWSEEGGSLRQYSMKNNISPVLLRNWVKAYAEGEESKSSTFNLVKVTNTNTVNYSNNYHENSFKDEIITINVSFGSIELPTNLEQYELINILSAIKEVE